MFGLKCLRTLFYDGCLPNNCMFDRYHSLCAYNGEDDLFSSDFSDDQLKQKLGHMSNTPCQVGDQVHSSFDSYFFIYSFYVEVCPSHVTFFFF